MHNTTHTQNTNQSNEDIMLRAELELLMKERETLLIIAGAAWCLRLIVSTDAAMMRFL